mgnify:FL=1
MADNIKSLDTLDILFADFIQSKLGLKDNQVLISYPQRGQKSSQIDSDVCYIKFFDEPDERHIWKNRKVETIEDNKIKVTQYTMRTLKLQLIFYGPNADQYSTKINELMYFDSTKQFLFENELALIPEKTVQPKIHYEKINEQWWHRSDLNLYFYDSISTEDILDTITDVNIKYKYENGG